MTTTTNKTTTVKMYELEYGVAFEWAKATWLDGAYHLGGEFNANDTNTIGASMAMAKFFGKYFFPNWEKTFKKYGDLHFKFFNVNTKNEDGSWPFTGDIDMTAKYIFLTGVPSEYKILGWTTGSKIKDITPAVESGVTTYWFNTEKLEPITTLA